MLEWLLQENPSQLVLAGGTVYFPVSYTARHSMRDDGSVVLLESGQASFEKPTAATVTTADGKSATAVLDGTYDVAIGSEGGATSFGNIISGEGPVTLTKGA